MQGYILRRLVGLAVNLVLVSILIFFLLRLLPGDLAATVLGQDARPEQVEAFRAQHGLDKSAPVQFLDWAGGVITGDLGTSIRSGIQITDEFVNRLPVTLEIVFFTLLVSTVFGIGGGVLSAVSQDSAADYFMRIVAIVSLSVPSFLILTLLLILPALWGYAPPFGATDFLEDPWANLQLILPACFFLGISSSAALLRITRSTLLDVLRQDYVRTARSKGLQERSVILRHAFRNAIPPIVTTIGLQLSISLSGSVVLESILGIPGLGNWALQSIAVKDYSVIMAVTLYAAVAMMVINLVVDLAYGILDPRITFTSN